MSDILIKGAKMPTGCGKCEYIEYDDYAEECGYEKVWYCPLIHKWVDEWYCGGNNKKPTFCPLVEIPPHGDLIDRDELMDVISHKLHDRAPSSTDVLLQLVFAPTVIESEEEK